jgi:hypothetical protein
MPDLRTVASPAGDEGRDAELFSPVDDPTQVLQYSVAKGWDAKIRSTAARISTTIPAAQVLIYVTNQGIGAHADALKRDLRTKHRLHLDVRDRSFFLERYRVDSRTESAAEALAIEIVDPYLASEGVLRRSPVLETYETKAAHVYLSLQLRDEVQEKGLTKLSFEALVRSVLIRTDSEHRLGRGEVKSRIHQLLPKDPVEQVDQLPDSALARLTKRSIRHWPKTDEFCLSHEESQRVAEYLAAQELSEAALLQEIQHIVKNSALADGDATPNVDSTTIRVRRILERCLYERAESFASAVLKGPLTAFGTDHLADGVLVDLRYQPAPKGNAEANPLWLESLVRHILTSMASAITLYLHDLADAYTVMAFLRQTPDVQSAVGKMFSHGEIWLDTSAVLPLLAEELIEDGTGQFQRMIGIAKDAGLMFFVTSGVIEELDHHIENALSCCRTGGWSGKFPFLLEAFLQLGRPLQAFPAWTEQFRGPKRPVDDIVEFLDERFGIRRRDLEAEALKAPDKDRHAVQEAWHRIHAKRREKSGNVDPNVVIRLSRHDTENYVGVSQLRTQEKPSPLGYSAWWLTFDRSALAIKHIVKKDFGLSLPDPPVLSLDFLAQYLTLGPVRGRVPKASLRSLPVVFEPLLMRFLTPELIREASLIREEMKDLPENVIRRRVRDHLDSARQRMGPLAERGAEAFFEEI